ncbi:hypothetical protein NM688_g6343 [Phlebia brevispora]|uniref:Uncharacterized protein n=1 Tax=Phlebia brevispora TaxID=194682 RepID=A0ACC1SH57_9APHY|nr:hypothetical protein NM688_g6343 [Phlebia brevispora]
MEQTRLSYSSRSRPASKGRVSPVVSLASSTPETKVKDMSHPSSQTFGYSTKPSKIGLESLSELDYDEQPPPSPSPNATFTRGHRHSRAASKASILSALCDSGVTIPLEAIKNLGLTGTLGGPEPEIDPEDPDSDIPDELQDLLASQSDEDTTQGVERPISPRRQSSPPSPGMPPEAPLPELQAESETSELPVLRVTFLDENNNEAEADDSSPASPSDNDTAKSFDFTGELRKLHESGASDRHSFVEQLENAFRTPARVDLDFHLEDSSFLRPDVPPVPPLPVHRSTPGEDLVPQSVSEPDISISLQDPEPACSRDSGVSDTLTHLMAECEDFCRPYGSIEQSPASMRSRESDGKLNTSFKFGGKPSISELAEEQPRRPLTLSDIIPPLIPRAANLNFEDISFTGNDSLVLKSIYGHACEDDTSVIDAVMQQATNVPPLPRPRLNSDSSSKRRVRGIVNHSHPFSSHSRSTSEASFTGFDSFDEIRRGFEFGLNRTAFYPPPGATSIASHGHHESLYSIASESSYGAVIRSGTLDPFGYGPNRPLSTDEISTTMSLTVDDTSSFLRRDPHRQRIDSDASSFYFRGVGNARRGHRRNESNLSVTSNVLPINLYNRSFGAHRRNDSAGSMSSIAQSYVGGRATWARHRQDRSMDFTFSEVSVSRLGRPGIGDKMFDNDCGLPLTAISGSPNASTFDENSGIEEYSHSGQPTSYDSIMGGDPRLSVVDSLFEQTGRSSRPAQFRPISMLSMASEDHTIAKEDDTMISMLGGGHVRRRSVDSWVEHSPSQGRKPVGLQPQLPGKVLNFQQHEYEEQPVPDADRSSNISLDRVILSKPSIASTSSYQSSSRESSPKMGCVRPIVTVEEATTDRHEALNDSDSMQTPMKSIKPRPCSMSALQAYQMKPMSCRPIGWSLWLSNACGVLELRGNSGHPQLSDIFGIKAHAQDQERRNSSRGSLQDQGCKLRIDISRLMNDKYTIPPL